MAVRDIPPMNKQTREQREERLRQRRTVESRPKSTNEPAKKKEKGMLESIVSDFIHDDIENVKHDVVENVIKPGISSILFNAITEAAGQLLGFGGGKSVVGRSTLTDYRGRSNAAANVSNNRSSLVDNNRAGNTGSSGGFDSRDFAFPSKGRAEEVLEILRWDIKDLGYATVATFLKEAGQNTNWNDNSIGWTELDPGSCYIRGSLDGYVIVLPRPVSVKNR